MSPQPKKHATPRFSGSLAYIGFNAHLAYFDSDDDQEISLRETRRGLSKLGLGHLITFPATALIHAGVAGLGALRGNLLNPLKLALPQVGVVRHPDTAMVDATAHFDRTRVDEAFDKYAKRYPGEALTLAEISAMATDRLRHQSGDIVDRLLLPGGAVSAFVEWGALLWLAGELRDGDRVLTKRATLSFFTDPSFFFEVAARLEQTRQQRAGSAAGNLRNLVQTWLL